QLSIFSGNWFDAEDSTAYKLPAELDLICTAHYLEALQMQAKASEIAGLLGGKMPHIMTLRPGGTAFVPTEEKLDDLKALADELYTWVQATMIPDTLAIASYYMDAFNWGKGCGRYIAWGVFEESGFDMNKRYLPAGVLGDGLKLSDVEESMITEYVGRSWYEGEETYQSPYYVTDPAFTEYNVDERYSWVKAPAYNGQCMEAGGLSRLLVAYKRGVPFVVEQIDGLLETLGVPGKVEILLSTMGRTGARQIETLYIAGLMKEWVTELCEALASGDSEYFRPAEHLSGTGSGFWEAPRGALYHNETVKDGKIEGYQIIIPSTWNLAPHNEKGEYGPMEQALVGLPVGDVEKPINALRTVHSFDPCTACAVHVSEPATGKKFQTVTSPWGVK
ncbi:MAG: nickel-dependent hydrogenase large subunit, partial [Raoultibacter sp.]